MARDAVFISYSHADRGWLQALRTQLSPLIRQRALVVWDDTLIEPGTRWLPQIEQAIAGCKVAVLLVSPDFLASDFIQQRELPPLLRAQADSGLRILWVHLRSCLYDATEIAHFQCAHDPAQPLDTLVPAQQGAALARIARRIRDAAVRPPGEADQAAPAAVRQAQAGTQADAVQYVLVLSGRVTAEDRPLVDALLSQLRAIAHDTRLTLQRVEQGSIRLLLSGSAEGYQRLFDAYIAGRLATLLGRQVLALGREGAGSVHPLPRRPLLGYVDPRAVRLDLPLPNRAQALRYVGKLFEEIAGLDAAVVSDNLFARERLGSTALGLGVALPHGRIKGLLDPQCALLRLREPVVFDAPDDEPVRLLVVLLVPEAATAQDLERLSMLAEMLSDPGRRDMLMRSDDVAAIHALLASWAMLGDQAQPKTA